MADQIFQVNSCSFQDIEVSASLRSGPGIIIDLTQATKVTGSFSGTGVGLTNVSASFIIASPTTTASWANNAQTASNVTSSNVFGTVGNATNAGTANTASYITSSNVIGKVSSALSADTASFVTASSVIGKVSSATSADTASFANTFTSSHGIQIGPGTDPARLHISASGTSNIHLIEIDSLTRDKVFFVDATGSLSATGSLQGTSSFSITSSNLNSQQTTFLSSSVTQTGTLSALATNLAFVANPGEIWSAAAKVAAQSNNNRGMRYAISSSTPSGTVDLVAGWVIAQTNAITAQTSVPFPDVNIVDATSLHTNANVSSADNLWFTVANNSASPVTFSVAIAVTNTADTVTAFAGSFMIANRMK